MEYRLYCIKHDGEKYIQIGKRILNEEEMSNIRNAYQNINKLKLIYEVPYPLKCNYNDFLRYIDMEPQREGSYIWNINKKIIEANRLIFNLVSSLNAIENHYKKILEEVDFIDLKHNYINVHYDNSLNYRFLYELRNYVNHSSVPATLAEFQFDQNTNYNKIYGNKESFLNDSLFKKKVKSEIAKCYPEQIDITNIIKNEIPAYIKVLLEYVHKYKSNIEKDINLIKEYYRKLNRDIKKIKNKSNLIYGIETPNKPGSLNLILPIDFIICFENNDLYIDIN